MSVVVKREQCATCRYFDEAKGEAEMGMGDGWCVRRPPVVEAHWARTVFPVIYPGTAQKTWCGEWEDAS